MRVRRDKLKPVQRLLVGFTGDRLLPLGTISLPITTGKGERQATRAINFLVVDYPSAYNAILGRHALNQLRAVTSTYHLLMQFSMDKGVREVKGDQVAAKECYMASLKGGSGSRENISIDSLEVQDERTRVLAEPGGELEDIVLNPDTPDETTRVGLDLLKEFKVRLRDFLVENRDVFAWTHEDMPEIDPKVAIHKLNVDPTLRPIK